MYEGQEIWWHQYYLELCDILIKARFLIFIIVQCCCVKNRKEEIELGYRRRRDKPPLPVLAALRNPNG
jgi:hypothetical protein